jgi:cytochrome c-type biogenesis protein CcmH/NrfG
VASISAITILLIWVIVQPLRSSDAYASALSAAARGDSAAALTAARDAAASDPVSVDPDFLLSRIYTGLGNGTAARRALIDAVSLQSSNPATWQQLGEYDLSQHRPGPALSELHRALVLDPASPQVNADIAAAHSASSAAAAKK